MQFLVIGSGGHGAGTIGKRTPYIKSLGRQIHEHEFNAPTYDLFAAELRRHGVHVYDDSPGDYDAPLASRVNMANSKYKEYVSKYGKANVKCVYVSIHFNAFDASFEGRNPSGFSVHVQIGSASKEAGKLAKCVIRELQAGTKQINRGIVEQNLQVTRETLMPAILSENGFMDNPEEALLMLNPDFQKEVATEHAKGVLAYFGIAYKPEVIEKEVTTESGVQDMTAADANKIITFLSAAYGICKDDASRKEFNRLANELRKASGQEPQ